MLLENLKTVTWTDFDTSGITDMNRMFAECSSLESLDLSRFDTSKVTNMHQMFYRFKINGDLNLSRSGKVKALKAGKGKKVKITAMATDGSGKKKSVTIKIK